MARRATKEEFIKKATNIHGSLYDYSKVEYINNLTPVHILCKKHNKYFSMSPAVHTCQKSGCPICFSERIGRFHRLSYDQFVIRATGMHGSKYDYSNTTIIDGKTPAPIYCNTHKEVFLQTPSSHIRGAGCPKCSCRALKTLDQFINAAKIVHGDLYDYSEVQYVTSTTKVHIKCNKHDFLFWQTPDKHINSKQGCPICRSSKGAKAISKYLLSKNIVFNTEVRFPECRDIYTLPFDFVVYKNNKLMCIIEYDGEQHYKAKYDWGGEDALLLTQLHDEIKNTYCITHNIRLLRIPYWERKNIETILDKELCL